MRAALRKLCDGRADTLTNSLRDMIGSESSDPGLAFEEVCQAAAQKAYAELAAAVDQALALQALFIGSFESADARKDGTCVLGIVSNYVKLVLACTRDCADADSAKVAKAHVKDHPFGLYSEFMLRATCFAKRFLHFHLCE